MRIESVAAHAFGPFDGETLRFAPGMTVVHGPNEAGKSTWHAALYAGLCGIRRARGKPKKEDAYFTDMHRPWEGDSWEVSVVVGLDDGRQIELRHDLDGRVDCRATDLVLGRDVSDEIISDGNPDGARWLGLDRRSFLSTACVRQADLLGVLADPTVLQEHLQRAAATAGTDATAAAAIEALRGFHSERVGRDWAHVRKPLRLALTWVREAGEALQRARTEHEDFLRLSAATEEARERAAAADRQLRAVEAIRAQQEAAVWEQRFSRARELAARYPDGPPTALTDDDRLAQEVAAAERAWDERPEIPILTGLSTTDLLATIASLPDSPTGDVEPSPDVLSAREAFLDAKRALDLHLTSRPRDPSFPQTGGAPEEDLRELAKDLETPQPATDSTLQERHDHLTVRLEALSKSSKRKLWAPLTAATLAAGAGSSLLALRFTAVGALLLAAAVGLVVWPTLHRGAGARVAVLEELRQVEERLGISQHAAAEAARRAEAARKGASDLGLPTDPSALRNIATRLSEATQMRAELERWSVRHELLESELSGAGVRLTDALRGRGVEVTDDPNGASALYMSACTERSKVVGEAAKKVGLEEQLSLRREAEKSAADAARRRDLTERSVREMAANCGVSGDDPDVLVERLREWQSARSDALATHEKGAADWAQLESLLDGQTVEELGAESSRKHAMAERLVAAVDEGGLQSVNISLDPDSQMEQLRGTAEGAKSDAAALGGQVEERARVLPSVPDAEEELVGAQEELERVQRLDSTLSVTLQFLERAQDRVHRDIAPVLADAVRRWLPEVTSNRYADVTVDPQNLRVNVRTSAGQWRNAALLSHGTAEQIYLLLRVALVQHLTKGLETCPLILDDITAQWDTERTDAALRALHALSSERQVILFSQETDVIAWAKANLHEPQDRLDHLDPVPLDT